MSEKEQNIKLTARILELQADIAQAEVYLKDERDKVRELEAEIEKHQWISVEDRLPERIKDERTPYLVRTTDYYGVALWREYSSGWDWECDCGEVTHWKPITLPADIEKGN
jgi:hypothetical protein